MKVTLALACLMASTEAKRLAEPYSETVANGDHFDDREIEDEWDPKDWVVDDNGFTRNWGLPTRPAAEEAIGISENQMQLYKMMKYSDTISNANADDDKELEEEEDPKNFVVDINGSGRFRFGAHVPND